MNQKELQDELTTLLENIYNIINEGLHDVNEQTFSNNQIISYIFFIRIVEIYKAILILFTSDIDQVVPAQMLLRSLSEYYILLKSSIHEEDFNDRHIRTAFHEKIKWLDKISGHHYTNDFIMNSEGLKSRRNELLKNLKDYENGLQSAFQLFGRQKELDLYLHVYAPASKFTHGDRQSFNIYYREDGGVQPTAERDYSSLLCHTGFAVGQIMLQSYEQFCFLTNPNCLKIQSIKTILKESAAKVQSRT